MSALPSPTREIGERLALALGPRAPAALDRGRPWRVWDLDAELRYAPVVAALPNSPGPVCEVGSGPRGIAAWTARDVIGVDPGSDDPHGDVAAPRNLQRVAGEGASIPLPDGAVDATLAVDTFEHIPRDARRAVVAEMLRVTRDGGRVIVMGPTGRAARRVDRRVLERWRSRDDGAAIVHWLSEHEALGLPTVAELTSMFDTPRVQRISARGVFNARLWWIMHRALLGDFAQPPAAHLTHHLAWAPFGALARRWARGPFYRYLVIAEVASK